MLESKLYWLQSCKKRPGELAVVFLQAQMRECMLALPCAIDSAVSFNGKTLRIKYTNEGE